MEKSSSTCDKTEAFGSEIDPQENYQNAGKETKMTQESDERTQKYEKSVSMEQFCYQFCIDYFDKVNQTISVQEMTKKYSVKNRRVYDLLGIFEGFSFVCRLKGKGTYMWMGLKNHHYQFHFDEKKSVSLKDVAGLIKVLMNNCKQGLTIKELNQKIINKIEETTKRQQCKKTINRRIYECLKVMKVFGMVQKQENIFKNTACKFKKPQKINLSQQNDSNEQKMDSQGDISRMVRA